ncbi:MAG: riboflavin biosynthesis protein RibF, partial [Bryobacteraceae bacterium]
MPADFGPSALTVGNFDGLHAGHRRILQRVAEIARTNGWNPLMLTFDPHPTRVVAPERAPRLMTTPLDRCRLMAAEGIRQALILPFSPEIAQLSPREFAKRILVDKLGARAVVVGDNFRFGHKQAGDTGLLAELGGQLGFTTEVIPAVTIRGSVVSSSEIRKLVEAGKVSHAGRLLERPFSLQGPVVRGRGVGSKQTVPTLNMTPETELLPMAGVYVTRTHDVDTRRHWPSVTNVGVRPTFGDGGLTIETFLLAPLEGESPASIRVEFLRHLREERKF